jgi:isoamylase
MMAGNLGRLTLSRLNGTPAECSKLAQQQAATLSPRINTLFITLWLMVCYCNASLPPDMNKICTSPWAAVEGSPLSPGVTWIPELQAYNFALYSEHAEKVTLQLYQESDLITPVLTHEFDYLKNKTGRVWHCIISASQMQAARYYAYSVDGPSPAGPLALHCFDPQKVLLDPYAKTIFFPPAFERAAAIGTGSNAGRAPLGLIPRATEHTLADLDPPADCRHTVDAIIYELHVRGFTQNPNSGVAPERRGKYAGVIDKIPYLKELGVTIVELMPVFQFDPGEGVYWGYAPLSFFAPHSGYADSACDAYREFREMVDALHAADIEVFLDVVYNHTCEGNEGGPTYSFKGIDNASAYLLSGDPAKPYADYSGTGNTLNFSNDYIRKVLLDSLRYWAREMRVDGFRFDLASVFSRKADGSLDWDHPPVFGQISSAPDLTGIRLIAEPWDASGGYQLGRGFPGITWSQWNADFRDDVRRFVKGDAGMVGSLMTRLYGSADLFPDDRLNAYRPYQSINFITAHDGFTLYDLVTYNHKRNWANGEDNRDGLNDNFSWNSGWDGDGDVPPEVMSLRYRQIKNFCCLLFLSAGLPMLHAGDEFLQTQAGNNNPYNQDNETSWLDWKKLNENPGMFSFFKKMIAFRKGHPTLCRSRFWRDDVKWFGVAGPPDLSQESRSLAFYLDGASENDVDLYVMLNSYWEQLAFTVQQGAANQWRRVIDTSIAEPDDFRQGADEPLPSLDYRVAPRSIVVLVRDRS